ncbi:unnamed protein product [Zymoseptoria tritici ST99CH_1A5]|uniref:Maintenance of telomere capping protein 6 n=1 Tax=Zymoseptoria tritici ST99CH_1A5 TaxID=1276529 RepID=A0A1Y6LXD5_ZYMTR|nr:unnamed protein product [Zymoseptoria tritici ST99CH_1A5]
MAASSIYAPDPSVIQDTRFVALLSQRDVSIQIPVNFVTQPGVVLAAACFGNGTYEDAAAARCVSNLLASGFRRIAADVYWDASRSVWQLCPVELGAALGTLTSSTSVASNAEPTERSASSAEPTSNNASPANEKRQDNDQLSPETLSSSIMTSSIASASRTISVGADATATAVTGTSTSPGEQAVFQIGPYYCSPTTDFDMLMEIFHGFFDATETNLNATTLVLSLHVHAAAPASAPLGSARQPADDRLPDSDSLLSARIAANNSQYLYTPTDLRNQRQNLNSSQSWFTVPITQEPDSSYFQVEQSGGTTSTPDGWPSESYIEISIYRRLMVQFGNIDPQMSSYNFDGDAATIFPSDYLAATPPISASDTGALTTGCFFDPSITTISTLNSSWAQNTIGNDSSPFFPSLLALASNLTSCGLSPILNTTLNSSTADQDPSTYQTFATSAGIWSWAPSQPINASSSMATANQRCAILNATSGRWSASDCESSRHAACRVGREPYVWRISQDGAPYDRVEQACDEDDLDFDVPRTALENAHLLSVWRNYLADHDDDGEDADRDLLYLDYNQLDVAGCWVQGSNSTCPYLSPDDNEQRRRIVVPVVAAVIVLGLGVLTTLVKCAGNRRTARRRRRRGRDGVGDYEGVPS